MISYARKWLFMMVFQRIALASPWIRMPIAGTLGMLVAAVPLMIRPVPGWINWIIYPSLLGSSVLVWYAFLCATEIWRPQLELFERLIQAFLLYLAAGIIFVVSAVLGAWPGTIGGSPGPGAIIVALFWPQVMMWWLFGFLSWYPHD